MEFTIASEELKKALHRAQGIVEKKATMPVLAHVLIAASKGSVSITACDLDTGVVSEHTANVTKNGSCTVFAKLLLDIVANAPTSEVTITELENHHVEVRSGAARYKVVGMGAEEFPKLPKDDDAHLVSLPGSALLDLIRKTAYAISNDEARMSLNGVSFETHEGGRIRMVASDGHRLSFAETAADGDFRLKGPSVIIPRKGLLALRRILEEDPSVEVQLGFAESSAMFKKPGLTASMRLLEGQFPDYQRVIPKESQKKFTLDRVRFMDTIRRIAILSGEKSNVIKLSLAENLLIVEASNQAFGEGRDEIDIAYRGEPTNVGFNARYFLDVLTSMDDTEVGIELGDAHSPALLYPSTARGSYSAVVMPMRA